MKHLYQTLKQQIQTKTSKRPAHHHLNGTKLPRDRTQWTDNLEREILKQRNRWI